MRESLGLLGESAADSTSLEYEDRLSLNIQNLYVFNVFFSGYLRFLNKYATVLL